MALTTQTMTDEQRKSVALEYLKAFDNGGTTSGGGSILDLFAEDSQVYFPKWGIAEGREQIGRMFGDLGSTVRVEGQQDSELVAAKARHQRVTWYGALQTLGDLL